MGVVFAPIDVAAGGTPVLCILAFWHETGSVHAIDFCMYSGGHGTHFVLYIVLRKCVFMPGRVALPATTIMVSSHIETVHRRKVDDDYGPFSCHKRPTIPNGLRGSL